MIIKGFTNVREHKEAVASRLPSDIIFAPSYACMIALTTSQDLADEFLGDVLFADKPTGTMTMMVKSDADMESITQFFYGTLLDGTEEFYINMTVFGVTREWLVRLTGAFSESITGSTKARTITAPFEIREDLSEIFVSYYLDVLVSPYTGDVTIEVDTDTTFIIDWGTGVKETLTAGSYTGHPFGKVRVTATDPIRQIKFGGDVGEINFSVYSDVQNADDMCNGLNKLIKFTNPHMLGVTTANRMMKDTAITTSSNLDLSTVEEGEDMWEGSALQYCDINTASMRIFTNFFANCVNLLCLKQIDTRNETDTTGMFSNTPELVNPTSGELSAILSGSLWTNTNPCPFVTPSQPTGFSASDDRSNEIQFTWTNSADLGYPVAKYDIYEIVNGVTTLVAEDVTTPHTMSGSYTPTVFFVRAYNQGGYVDSTTDSGESITAPNAPSNFVASDNQVNQVTCTWTNASGFPAPKYNVYEDDVLVGANVSSGYVRTLPNGGTHTYYVEAYNDGGSFESNTNSGTAYDAPSTISNFNATDGETSKTTLTWSNASGYPSPTYVAQYYNGSSWINLTGNITSPYVYNNTSWKGNMTLRIRALNDGGVSYSNNNTGVIYQPTTYISNFAASDGYVGYSTITFTASGGYPTPTYDLYEGTTLLKSGVYSGYKYYFTGKKTMRVLAKNAVDETYSNTNSGTGMSAAGSKTFTSNGTFTAPYGYSTVTVCMVGGGGGGDYGSQYVEGGGAGQVRSFSTLITEGDSYSIVIGAGGLGGSYANGVHVRYASAGGETSAFSSTSSGGSAGGQTGNGGTRTNCYGSFKDGSASLPYGYGGIAGFGNGGAAGIIGGNGGYGAGGGSGAVYNNNCAGGDGGKGLVKITWS